MQKQKSIGSNAFCSAGRWGPTGQPLFYLKPFLETLQKGNRVSQRDQQDIIGGLLLTALGVFVAFYAQRYSFGTLARMGPGFFPTVLGILLAVLGALVTVPAFLRHGNKPSVQWGTFAIVIGSLVLFAFTLKVLGLILATFAAAFLASLADRDITWRGRVMVSAGVAFITWLIFIVGLQMILPVWWWSH
jgi:hypothetical protein